MCRPVTCRTCSKTTWSGCGAHVNQVKARVPADQWCGGHPKASTATNDDSRSWLRRLLKNNGGS